MTVNLQRLEETRICVWEEMKECNSQKPVNPAVNSLSLEGGFEASTFSGRKKNVKNGNK
jgi:hypothetical protein